MRCQRCGRSITPLRQLTDLDFCSERCRRKGPRASASALHDLEYEKGQAPARDRRRNAKASLAALAGVTAGLLISLLLNGVQAPLRVHASFDGQRTDFAVAQPARLRLWTPTLAARDYSLEFRGTVVRKALGWAFRAQDARNYYATKIVILRPGEISGAHIVHYGVQAGRQFARAQMPIPMALHSNRPYRIQVDVDEASFSTRIDGVVVDRWTDHRIPSGGVGFFSDGGEFARIEWADFREHKPWLAPALRFMCGEARVSLNCPP